MSYRAFLRIGLLSLFAVVVTIGSAVSFGFERAYAHPFFDPVDELRLQAVIAEDKSIEVTADEKLKLLPGIEIRTAIEDYLRLHYELG